MTLSRSISRLGQRFWLSATSPSCKATVVARLFGSRRAPSPSVTSAFGSSGPAVITPRRRWYLNERPKAAHPGGEQSRGERIAGMTAIVATVEAKTDDMRSIDQAALGEAARLAGACCSRSGLRKGAGSLASGGRLPRSRGSSYRASPPARPGNRRRDTTIPDAARRDCRADRRNRRRRPRRPPGSGRRRVASPRQLNSLDVAFSAIRAGYAHGGLLNADWAGRRRPFHRWTRPCAKRSSRKAVAAGCGSSRAIRWAKQQPGSRGGLEAAIAPAGIQIEPRDRGGRR